jgi:hypothetical protein
MRLNNIARALVRKLERHGFRTALTPPQWDLLIDWIADEIAVERDACAEIADSVVRDIACADGTDAVDDGRRANIARAIARRIRARSAS